MKNTILSLAFVSINFFSYSQISISERSESFSVGSQNALVVSFRHSDKDKVEKEWKNLIKDFKPDDVKDKKGEYFFDNTKFLSVSPNAIDVYSVVEGKDGEIKLKACFNLGGAYANSSAHSKEINYFKTLMHDFAVKMAKDDMGDKVKDASKVLEKITDKKESLEKDNKNLEGDIVSYNEKIKKANEKIEANKKEIETKKGEITAQEKVVKDLKKQQDDIK